MTEDETVCGCGFPLKICSKTEREWRDFFSGKVLQNYTLPWVGSRPDGGLVQNCACLLDENTWGDEDCDWWKHACMCTSLVLKSAIFENGKYQHFFAGDFAQGSRVIGIFGYLAIWLRATNMPEWGIPEKSIKNVAQRR